MAGFWLISERANSRCFGSNWNNIDRPPAKANDERHKAIWSNVARRARRYAWRDATVSFPSPSPLGEGESSSAWRTFHSHWHTTTPCSLFPLPEGEGQGEG